MILNWIPSRVSVSVSERVFERVSEGGPKGVFEMVSKGVSDGTPKTVAGKRERKRWLGGSGEPLKEANYIIPVVRG